MRSFLEHKISNEREFCILYYSDTVNSELELELHEHGYRHVVRISPDTIFRRSLNLKEIWDLSKNISRSKFIISSTPYERSFVKFRSQVYTVVNYYIPFKSDLHIKSKWCKIDKILVSSPFGMEYIASTADIGMSAMNVTVFPRVLGMSERDSLKTKQVLNYAQDENIIVFAPTHRNMSNGPMFSPKYDWSIIDSWLIQSNYKLVILPHPELNIELDENTECIEVFNTTSQTSTYDILTVSNLLISDYSSIHFDYLYLKKPIIYFWPDFHEFTESRGFMCDSPEKLCAGPIAYSTYELIEYLDEYLENSLINHSKRAKDLYDLVYPENMPKLTEEEIINNIFCN